MNSTNPPNPPNPLNPPNLLNPLNPQNPSNPPNQSNPLNPPNPPNPCLHQSNPRFKDSLIQHHLFFFWQANFLEGLFFHNKLFQRMYCFTATLPFYRGICFSRPSAPYVGPRPSAPGPVTFTSTGFDFLPVYVVKCSCAKLIKHICEFSIHKY